MTVSVLLFAGAREAAGADELSVELPEDATFGLLAEELARQHPGVAPMVARARFAAAAGYVTPDDIVDPAAEIALIPPVSGG